MEEFLKFFDKNVERCPMRLEITYSQNRGWQIWVYAERNGEKRVVFTESGCDPEYLFAKAQVSLKHYLLENKGGYKK